MADNLNFFRLLWFSSTVLNSKYHPYFFQFSNFFVTLLHFYITYPKGHSVHYTYVFMDDLSFPTRNLAP